MSRNLKASTLCLFVALSVFSLEANAQTPVATTPVEQPKELPRQGFSWSADLGGTARRIYSVPIYGGEFELSFGGTSQSLTIYGTIGLMLGQTSEGLMTSRLSLGPSFLYAVSERVRLGASPRLSVFAIKRATLDDSLGGTSLGIHGIATIDITQMDPGKLYTGIRLGADYFQNSLPNAWLWGGTLDIGFRY